MLVRKLGKAGYTPLVEQRYTYLVTYSSEDNAYIGRCLEFPSLAVHGQTLGFALSEIQSLVFEALCDLEEQDQDVPIALGYQPAMGQIFKE